MSQYAANTKVSVEDSEREIKRTLTRYGADQFLSGTDSREGYAMIGFRVDRRQVKMFLPLPKLEDMPEVPPREPSRRRPTREEYWEQSCRQRWRALALIVKAKLEAVESGISTVEREFLADVVMPNGQTVYEWARPQVEQMYLTGKMPPLLPAGPGEVK